MGIKTQIKAKELESSNQFNISLLGFKMAITEGLTIFNLVDGIVDEFEDESGVDNSASTTLLYNSTDDYYVNSDSPDGVTAVPMASTPYSAGFTTTTITEPDTSTVGTNPTTGSGNAGKFTVPSGLTSITGYLWGAGGGSPIPCRSAGGGGFSTGNLAVTPGQVLTIGVGETGTAAIGGIFGGGDSGGAGGAGGGASFILTSCTSWPSVTAPGIALVAGGGGGSGGCQPRPGGAGGGLIGHAADTTTGQTAQGAPDSGGGGSQSAGGSSATSAGSFKTGGGSPAGPVAGGGGGGYYGGGAGLTSPTDGGGGGGSSYYGHPQITSGSTEDGSGTTGGGTSNPFYVASTNNKNQDGYVLLTGNVVTTTCASVTSSTIISDPFNANVVPTASRIVVFEENVGTPTLNTDVIASVSRNNGSNFTTVTLTDTGYVTGSSGQRILTGQADISGQPSGQSMKWKLQLANQTVKIHGVSLQWS